MVFFTKFAIHWQDDEDQAYLMDDAGNIEPSQAPNQAPQSPVCPEEESADVWGDGRDDKDYLESLEDFEQKQWGNLWSASAQMYGRFWFPVDGEIHNVLHWLYSIKDTGITGRPPF